MTLKLSKILFSAFLALPTLAFSNWADKSKLGTVDMVVCTAAVMKSGMGIDAYRKWTSALEGRYKKMYPTKTHKDIDLYVSERIIDKRASLQRQGIQTTPAFKQFYDTNCKAFHP
jgi:hypothetical protein